MADDDLQPLIEHLAATTPLDVPEARRVVQDVIAYLTETPEDYVRRRHQELKQSAALRNDVIFERLAEELMRRVFAMPRLSARQLRRIIYG